MSLTIVVCASLSLFAMVRNFLSWNVRPLCAAPILLWCQPRSFENGFFLAYANYAETENGLSYLGANFIAAPDGEILARAGATDDAITAKIAKSCVKDAQNRLPYQRDVGKIRLDDNNAPPSADTS